MLLEHLEVQVVEVEIQVLILPMWVEQEHVVKVIMAEHQLFQEVLLVEEVLEPQEEMLHQVFHNHQVL
tara:strand:+ start:157 stop:360 length:204 start_codon:yes stop_codon:yes gene_type:complete